MSLAHVVVHLITSLLTRSPVMLTSTRRPWMLLVPLVVFVVFVALYNAPNSIPRPFNDNFLFGQTIPEAKFVQTFLENPIDGPHDLAPLRELCASRQWTEGLILKCAPTPGGVGNVRNMLLNCLRFGLEAGGKKQFQGLASY